MKKKTLALLLSLVLVFGVIAGGTIAWLTAQSDVVVNTFTASDLGLTITETPNATVDGKSVWKGTVVPGGKQDKDPTLTVDADSVDCYVYALVENNMAPYVTYSVDGTYWEVVKTEGNKVLYRYKTVVATKTTAQKLEPVFKEVNYSGELITKDNIAEISDKTITVQGYAHQSVNTNQTTADAAAIGYFWPTVTP